MAIVAGIDGCRAGWLIARLDTATGAAGFEVASAWPKSALVGWARAAVDMPIGLAEAGPRACDVAARKRLPPGRKSSVFPPPRRYMLACADWRAAQAAGRAREGVGLSRQAWNLAAKIREIDAAIGPEDQRCLREAHPELLFHHLNAGAPLPSKKTPEGAAARARLLERAGLRVPPDAAGVAPGAARSDDVLDALACALVARRVLEGRARRLPEAPPRDRRGLLMEIWI